MAWTLCLSGSAIWKAGANVNATAVDYANNQVNIDQWSDESEGEIEALTGKSYVANIANLPHSLSGSVANVCSCLIAMKMIAYNTTGYLTREADTLLNLYDKIVNRGIAQLKNNEFLKLQSPVK